MVSETDPEQRIALLSNALPSLLSSELSIDDGAFFNLLQGPNGLSYVQSWHLVLNQTLTYLY